MRSGTPEITMMKRYSTPPSDKMGWRQSTVLSPSFALVVLDGL